MVWDYGEVNPFADCTGGWLRTLDRVTKSIARSAGADGRPGTVRQETATALSYPDGYFDAIITGPPYYDAVPYADLSDFFYVWLKRTVGHLHADLFRSSLTPKSAEIVQLNGTDLTRFAQKDEAFYRQERARAFGELHRVLKADGCLIVIFPHRSALASRQLMTDLTEAGLVVTASWPLRTDRGAELIGHSGTGLPSSILLVCRTRRADLGVGHFDEVQTHLEDRLYERLHFLWQQDIRGCDFFVVAIGTGLEVFGRYEQIRRSCGEPIIAGDFLDEARAVITDYVLRKLLLDDHVSAVDPATRFYVIWQWTYRNNRSLVHDARTLARALDTDLDHLVHNRNLLRGRTFLRRRRIEDRVHKNEDLGEPGEGIPAPLIDVVHRGCFLWEREDRVDLSEFLNRALMGRDDAFWCVAQSLSDILPDGSKENQLLKGLLVSQGRLRDVPERDKLL
jgi:adenine-specific DNA methylase